MESERFRRFSYAELVARDKCNRGDVRPAKTQQKISGRLRSETTTEHRYAIRGYLSTAAKHGTDVMTAIRDALLGRAWIQPDPTPA